MAAPAPSATASHAPPKPKEVPATEIRGLGFRIVLAIRSIRTDISGMGFPAMMISTIHMFLHTIRVKPAQSHRVFMQQHRSPGAEIRWILEILHDSKYPNP